MPTRLSSKQLASNFLHFAAKQGKCHQQKTLLNMDYIKNNLLATNRRKS